MNRSSVVIVAIAGGSGSGKTTFARMLQANLKEDFCGWLGQDRYYFDLPEQLRGKINYDHPSSLEFDLLDRHLTALRQGEDIWVPQYDFANHTRLPDWNLFSVRPIIVLDGILLLSQPELRRHFDFSFFIDTHEEIRFQRRLYRDTRERGRSPESVREQFYSQVKPMHDQFVEPSRQFANRIVSGEKSFGPVIEEIVFGLRPSPAPLAPQL